MKWTGFLRLRERPKGDQPASFTGAEGNELFKTFFALIPTETMAVYQYAKGIFAQSDPVATPSTAAQAIAWVLLGATLFVRYLGTLPPPEKKQYLAAQWDVVVMAGVAFALTVFMDGGTLWPAPVLDEDGRRACAIIGLIAALAWTSFQAWRRRIPT